MIRAAVCLGAVALVLLPATGGRGDEVDAAPIQGTPLSAEQIDDCVRENLPDRTSRQQLRLRVTDRGGLVDDAVLETFWKRFPNGYWRVYARFVAPSNVRGTSLLIFERGEGTDIFVYLPELRRVRRINKRTMDGALAGTDLTFEDWERLQGLTRDTQLERLPDDEIEGRRVYVLAARSAYADETSYDRIVTWVDERTCVVLRSEVYEKNDRLRKVVTVPVNAVWPERNGWIPRYTRIQDQREGSQTEVFLDDVVMDEPLADRYFSQATLAARGR